MEFTPNDIAISGLAIAVLAHAISWIFTSPKESRSMLEIRQRDFEQGIVTRIQSVERDHRMLERDFIASSVRLGQKMESQTDAINALVANVKELSAQIRSRA